MGHAYSIFEAKAKLSELLRHVKLGREIIINERGTPIAKVIPFQKQTSLLDRLKRLESIGCYKSREKYIHKKIYTVKRTGGLKRFLEQRE